MRCQSCDSELQPGAKFCEFCGAPVQETPAEPPIPAFQALPPVQELPPYPPAEVYPPDQSYAPPPSGGKVLGMEADKFGLVALGLGIAGLVLSCLGCGGLISILGVIAGILALKSPARTQGIIGLVLSLIGVLLSLVVVCAFLFALFGSASYNGYY